MQIPAALDYLLYLPKDYDKQDAWPLLVFLHGAGERGNDLDLVKKHGPPKLIEAGKEYPFIVVSPQCSKDSWWTWQLRELAALVDDVTRITRWTRIASISPGSAWGALAHGLGGLPTVFAAIMPICGGEKFYIRAA